MVYDGRCVCEFRIETPNRLKKERQVRSMLLFIVLSTPFEKNSGLLALQIPVRIEPYSHFHRICEFNGAGSDDVQAQ